MKIYLSQFMQNKNLHMPLAILCILLCSVSCSKKINLSDIIVPEEGGINLVKLTEDNDMVVHPLITSSGNKITWVINPVLAISPSGEEFAFLARKELSKKDYNDNIMIKKTQKAGASVQRSFRSNIFDIAWSKDGKDLCFTESRLGKSSIYLTSATEGSVIQQISNGISNDSNPVFSEDSKTIYFTRADAYGFSLWSYNRDSGLFSSYSQGMNAAIIPRDKESIICVKASASGDSEIWKLNLSTGVEQLILSQPKRSFTTPAVSPDGKWILCVSNTTLPKSNKQNLDIFAVKIDGSKLTQITYHPGNDLSPCWSPDGKSIYFMSQRGANNFRYNIWKMNFPL